MLPEELRAVFRSEVQDELEPYLWTDDDVWGYMDWAQKEFVRLMGGISDSTSDVTKLNAITGEEFCPYSERIMKFRRAKRLSDQRRLSVVTFHEADQHFSCDYGAFHATGLDDSTGPVTAMVVGMEEHQVRWVQIPAASDVIQCTVLRLPLCDIAGEAGEEFEVRAEYHRDLLLGMKHLAFLKQDGETFDHGKSQEMLRLFRAAGSQAATHQAMRNQTLGAVRYGGL